ncbi:nuclear transport factor 2 family protein [uncultured Psychroserpens sp.]|uniref:YybH family protein n=1 Tax=uncultured Psychroserpens sp. TaxID=255436 RepID=UPI002604B763|nr:nuclear transport factor 2 family protein [uncultured Psychroserpens sp.]
MKKYIYCFCIVALMSCQTETKQIDVVEVSEDNTEETKAAIKEVMTAQEIAWNNHDLEGFMQGYWRSNSLKFYGSNGLTQGWDNTLANYKKGYPTPAESGTLRFVINDISKIENGNYWVMGEYHLTRPVGDANGVFMIIFKKIDGQWKIVADMSC